MKLLIISKHLLNLQDAQAQQSNALVLALANAGYELDVICGSDTSNQSEHDNANALRSHPMIRLHALPASWYASAQSISQKIRRKVVRNFWAICIGDWARQAGQLATNLFSEKRHRVLISIALPMESHFAANFLHRKLPWVACMSDPWPEYILPAPYSDFSLPILSQMQRKAVQRVLDAADRIIFTCDEMLDYMRSYYSGLESERVALIPHIAPEMRCCINNVSGGDRRIVHSGALSRERVSIALAVALSRLPKDDPLQLHFIGYVHPRMMRMFEEQGVLNRIIVTPWMEKQQVLTNCESSSACLLIEAQMPEYPFLPSKLADYSSTRRPILAVTGQASPTSRLLSEYNAGIAAPHDPEAIVEMLITFGELPLDGRTGLHTYFAEDSIANHYQHILAELIAK